MHRRELLHLLASAAAVPALTGLAPGRLLGIARTAHGAPAGAPLRALDSRRAEMVATIAEHIIPETDTPGARAAGVEAFIDRILADWYDPDERERFLEGLAGVDARGRTAFGAEFLDLPEDRQVAILEGLDAEAAALRGARDERRGEAAGGEAIPAEAAPPEAADRPPEGGDPPSEADAGSEAATETPSGGEAWHFFDQVKWLTLYGYYTSEVGVTQELGTLVIPGRYDPCMAAGLRPERG